MFTGSMPGGNDVQDFTRVGIANSIIIHNLRLQNGHAYMQSLEVMNNDPFVSSVIMIYSSGMNYKFNEEFVPWSLKRQHGIF